MGTHLIEVRHCKARMSDWPGNDGEITQEILTKIF